MKLTKLLSPALGLLTLSLLFNAAAFSQAPTCQLSVAVIDKKGDLIEGAKVVLRTSPRGRAIRPPSVTGTGGVIFHGLRPGFYTLTVTKARYKRTIQTESLTCIQPEDQLSTEVVLERGNPRQTVSSTVLRLVETVSRAPAPESPPSSTDVAKDVSLPQEDYGVDIAAVIVAEDYLVEEPGSSTPVVKVAGSDLLALVDRTPIVRALKEEWYQAIHVNSGVEGWIRGDAIKIKYSKLKKSVPLFSEERAVAGRTPRVDINNASNVDLTLRIKGKIYVVAAHSKRIIYLQPGTYKYYGFAPGVMPAFGEQNFRAGHKYTWRFLAEVKIG
jgi:hypothetical protein